MNTPDPGEGYRLVTDYSEAPHPEAQIWLPGTRQWHDRITPLNGYVDGAYYRVPIDPAPVPPIPLDEDPLPFFNEPDRSPVVVIKTVEAVKNIIDNYSEGTLKNAGAQQNGT